MTRPALSCPAPPRLVVAGVASGVGKTTVTAAIAAALVRRGLVVQPFKTGPDFIDPGFLAAAAGRPCGTLDGWMMAPAQVRALFARRAAGADLAIVEGVMGLHDGVGGDDDRGSAADLARILDAPVVLVLDARGAARSAAAVALGFQLLDPSVRVVGVVANQVGGERHAALVAGAVAASTGLVPLGWLPRGDAWALPSRHLGLVGAAELARRPGPARGGTPGALGGDPPPPPQPATDRGLREAAGSSRWSGPGSRGAGGHAAAALLPEYPAPPAGHPGCGRTSGVSGQPAAPALEAVLDALARQAEATLDLDRLVSLARTAPPLRPGAGGGPGRRCRWPGASPAVIPDSSTGGAPKAGSDRGRSAGRRDRFGPPAGGGPDGGEPAAGDETAFAAVWRDLAAGRRVALAWDAAFAFAYADTLDALRHLGAAIEPFSPLADEPVPAGVDLVYLPGGYPELHAAALAAGRRWAASLARHLAAGGRLYAECGGLMTLGRELVDVEGRAYPMAGLLPIRTRMGRRRAALGYVEVIVEQDNLLGPAGCAFRGHEFHYSTLEPAGGALRATTRLVGARARTGSRGGEAGGKPDGFAAPGLLAGYAHLPLALYPEALLRLLGLDETAPGRGPGLRSRGR